MTTLVGYCPMGCGQTLFVAAFGYITCSSIKCPDPGAVTTILSDPVTDHTVRLGKSTFDIQHPLRERANGALFKCGLHGFMKSLSGPPRTPGKYVAHQVYDAWVFTKATT